MEHLSSMAALPYSRALTTDDLDELPDDGHRYELLDGSLIVTPAPGARHQTAVVRLWQAFELARPDDMVVFVAPYEWRLTADTALQPDVLVCRRADVGEKYLSVPPLVTAEALSVSTRSIDLSVKRDRYEAAGVTAYWVVDPEVPAVTVFGRQPDGRLAIVAEGAGDEEIAVQSPFAVRVRPTNLLVL